MPASTPPAGEHTLALFSLPIFILGFALDFLAIFSILSLKH
jgi:hypothetical protein